MRHILGIVLFLIATSAAASSITLSVPDNQDATVVAGRDAYNTRTGQTLTTKQWILQVMRASVIAELAQQQQAAAEAAVKAAQATFDAAQAAQAAQVQQVITNNSGDAWGLPATPRPTPQPTPTVPVQP